MAQGRARPLGKGQFTPLFFLVAAAALTLAILGYRASREVAAADEDQRIASSNREAESLVDRVEQSIIDTENVIFHLLDVESEASWEPWDEVVRSFPLARSAFLLDRSGAVRNFASRRTGAGLVAFQKLLAEHILPAIPWDELELRVGSLKHVHLKLAPENRYYLLSIVPRLSSGELLAAVLEVDMDNVLGDIFVKTFAGPARTLRMAVVDDDNAAFYGTPIVAPSPLGALHRFPTTLYRWSLRLEPVVASRRWWENGLTIAALVIAIALGVILSGLAALAFAVQRARRYAGLQSEFVSNVSHELRTPLSLIRMFAELLAIGKARDRDREVEYSRIIMRESERLAFLIDNVLDFSRLERGETGFDRRPVQPGALVQSALEVFRPRIEREGQRLEVDIEPALPDVLGDPNALTLAVLNLVDNAVKYSGGRGTIRVSARRAGSQVELAVADEGPGIPAEFVDQVFERFFRVPSPLEQKPVRGSGIGLALVKAIATHHGGRVSVESTPGKGSEFRILLPAAPAGVTSAPAPAEVHG